MQTGAAYGHSIWGLIQHLGTDARTLLHREIQLAKAEVSEEVCQLARASKMCGSGALVFFGGFVLLIFGLGWLASWAFAQAGLPPMFAVFVGCAAAGLFLAGLGGGVLFLGFRQVSRAFTRTKDLVPGLDPSGVPKQESSPAGGVSVAEMKGRVEKTEHELEADFKELLRRLDPRELSARIKHQIQSTPYSAGFAAVAAGFIGGWLLTRGPRHRARDH